MSKRDKVFALIIVLWTFTIFGIMAYDFTKVIWGWYANFVWFGIMLLYIAACYFTNFLEE